MEIFDQPIYNNLKYVDILVTKPRIAERVKKCFVTITKKKISEQRLQRFFFIS